MIIADFFNFLLHIDEYLRIIVEQYGVATYAILFFIIFFETGLVLTPFLPGDSLIFITGTIAAQGLLDLFLLFFLLSAAAILGDSLNYYIGKYLGDKIEKSKFFKKNYLEITQKFYEEHGGKTIILARFIPIVRTFAPFVAGISKMNYARFLSFNVVGGIVWVALFLFSGYYFGLIPFVQNNLTLIVVGVIIISFIPPVFEYFKASRKKRN